jgi:hypothetical protein
MKNKIVGTVMLVIVAIAVYIMTGCSSSEGTEPDSAVRTQAQAQWDGLDPTAQDMICGVYLNQGQDNEEWFRENMLAPDSDELAQVKMDIMSEECK